MTRAWKPEKGSAPLGASKGLCVLRQESQGWLMISDASQASTKAWKSRSIKLCPSCKLRTIHGSTEAGLPPGDGPGRRPACPRLTLGVVAAGGSWWQYGHKGFSLLSWSRAPDGEACLAVEHIEGLLYSWKHLL